VRKKKGAHLDERSARPTGTVLRIVAEDRLVNSLSPQVNGDSVLGIVGGGKKWTVCVVVQHRCTRRFVGKEIVVSHQVIVVLRHSEVNVKVTLGAPFRKRGTVSEDRGRWEFRWVSSVRGDVGEEDVVDSVRFMNTEHTT
jgi:hypothetical protein